MRTLALALFAPLLVVGCGDGSAGLDASAPGSEETYLEPFADGNSFACVTCHALSEPAPDGFRRPGHPIGDSANRPTYKNGQLTSLLDAVNTCVTEWMSAPPLAEGSRRWTALEDFLRSEAGSGVAPPVEIQRVDPPSDLRGGDRTGGRALFNTSCAVCHGEDGIGTRRGPSLVGADVDAELVARRVRTSGRNPSSVYEGLTGGVMPFWGADRLSDEELLDIVAFVVDTGRPPADAGAVPTDAGTAPTDAGTTPTDASAADAGATDGAAPHALVGRTASFITRFHDVAGTVTVEDDRTLLVEGFNYDGRGIDVRFYGALGGNFRTGFAIGGDLVRATPYVSESFRLTLPSGRTLDEMDSISVWCVDVSISFGDLNFL